MPNHVHTLVTATVPLPKLTKSLKGITARKANAILGLTGRPFWQEESYDHVVRDKGEFEKIRRYIEENPVRAGMVRNASEYRWSSVGRATGGSHAEAPPHNASAPVSTRCAQICSAGANLGDSATFMSRTRRRFSALHTYPHGYMLRAAAHPAKLTERPQKGGSIHAYENGQRDSRRSADGRPGFERELAGRQDLAQFFSPQHASRLAMKRTGDPPHCGEEKCQTATGSSR